jgi:alpha-galactosidase
MISRRTFLGAAAAAGAGLTSSALARSRQLQTAGAGAEIVRDWNGSLLRMRVVNRGRTAVRLRDLVVFEQSLSLPPDTALYGEGFQMLTQTAGTLARPVDLSQYTDAKHYRIPAATDARAFYGLLTLTPPDGDTRLFAFTSCARFCGYFVVQPEGSGAVADGSGGRDDRWTVRAIVDCEGLALEPGESWPLEELMVATGPNRPALLQDVATRLSANHAPLKVAQPPTGWCSWYCFGPNVTAQQVLDNLDAISATAPALRYIQIDDGYQAAMGDWLETGAAFGGSVRDILAAIRKRGFEPAIWVAPFIAEAQSQVFRQHPDWFIRDAGDAPLRADRVTFGGWRHGPWYALDGTHPEAQAHLERVFRAMRRDWGCTYFKLDANFWGAMHGGRFHDPHATRVDAYRRGMEAVRRGAGDAFLLGCNHPIWPSAGLIHGSRSSNDIKRTWDRVVTTARQNLNRNWQNGQLWWNDPDAVVLDRDLTDEECRFHATAIYASGGMVLSGDDLTKIPAPRASMLQKLLPPTGRAAVFADASLRVGTIALPGATMMCLFNWDAAPETMSVDPGREPGGVLVTDVWTGESLGRHARPISFTLPPRSARLLKLTS